jgi:hypothetical protein
MTGLVKSQQRGKDVGSQRTLSEDEAFLEVVPH